MTPAAVTARRSPHCSIRCTCPITWWLGSGAPFTSTSITCHTPRRSGAASIKGSVQPDRTGGGKSSPYPPGGVLATGISLASTTTVLVSQESRPSTHAARGGIRDSVPVTPVRSFGQDQSLRRSSPQVRNLVQPSQLFWVAHGVDPGDPAVLDDHTDCGGFAVDVDPGGRHSVEPGGGR